MTAKWLKIIRFEPRFHHMKEDTRRFYVVKARIETMHLVRINTLNGRVSIRKNCKKNEKSYKKSKKNA